MRRVRTSNRARPGSHAGHVWWALASALVAAGCAPDATPDAALARLALPDGCQPLLGGAECRLPYPSDYFRRPAAEGGGFRVELRGAAKPLTDDEYSADVGDWRTPDGFSPHGPILATLGRPLAADQLVGLRADHATTMRASSRTLLLESESGAFVPHFAEVDVRTTDPGRQALILRPVHSLQPGRRYIAALQGLVDTAGAPIPAPEGFLRLRDATSAQDPALREWQRHYDEQIFAPLAAAGVARDALQLAWDFTTGSEAWATADLLDARNLALAALAAAPPRLVVEEVVESDEVPHRWRKIEGYVEAPRFVEHDAPGARLVRDAGGHVVQSGIARVPVTLVIPACVRDRPTPAPLVQYGHGFFYARREAGERKGAYVLEQLCAVGVAVDWWGMSVEDIGLLLGWIGDQVWETPRFTDRVVQSMINGIAATTALLEGAPLSPELLRPTSTPEGGAGPGEPYFGRDRLHFLGISMGHILGGVYAALHPRLERVILHVGGASFGHIMFRASPFEPLLAVLRTSVPDPLDQHFIAASLQRQLDGIDPATWAPYLRPGTLPRGPGGPAGGRAVLLQLGVGDTQVPNFASLLHARALGLSAIGPQPLPLPGIDEHAAPHEGSGLTAFDFGIDPSFNDTIAPIGETSPIHNELRLQPAVLQQMRRFLEEGIIEHPCEGPCRLDPIGSSAINAP